MPRACLRTSLRYLPAMLLAFAAGCAPDGTPDLPSVFVDCHVTDASGLRGLDAQCASLDVPEDPQRPDGTRIELAIVRVPALAPSADGSAFTIIQGGPGGSSIDLYLTIRGAFADVHRTRDILLVDQRGTGRSNALHCPESDGAWTDLEPPEEPTEIREQFERCLDALVGDPRFYTTSVAVADLERVRIHTGYERFDLYGASYGTRVALHYLRRFPDRVRTLVLDGVVPVDWVLGPSVARDAQRSLDLLFARCVEDDDCRAHFPDPAASFAVLLAQLDATPLDLALRHPVTGEVVEMSFGRAELAVATRMLSYQPEARALLPLLVERALAGDAEPFAAQALIVASALRSAIAIGMHNAVVCSEDMPLLEAATPPADDDSYLGEIQLEVMRTGCEAWPRGLVDDDLAAPFESDVPALVLSGSADPVTPPDNGRQAARNLSRSREIVGAGQGHGLVMRGCLPRLLGRFVETADPDALDPACVDDLAPPPIFTSFAGGAP